MEDRKPWYEKIGIWIGIIAAICAILGISVFGDKSLFKDTKAEDKDISLENNEINTRNQSPVVIGDGNTINYENGDFENMVNSQSNDQRTSSDTMQYYERPQGNNESKIPSEEELLIEQNWDLIQQLKSGYSDENTKIVGYNSVGISFFEKSGYLYQDLLKTGVSDILRGNEVTPDKVIIMDYQSDNITYTFSPQKNHILYSPDNQNKFYCVVFCENYDIYVSPPIMVTGEINSNSVLFYLDKNDDKYTPLFRMRAYRYDTRKAHFHYILSSDYLIDARCENKYTDEKNAFYNVDILDSGMLSINGYDFISLNTNYVMNFYLYHKSNLDLELSNITFDGYITNSNLINLCFPINSENNIEN